MSVELLVRSRKYKQVVFIALGLSILAISTQAKEPEEAKCKHYLSASAEDIPVIPIKVRDFRPDGPPVVPVLWKDYLGREVIADYGDPLHLLNELKLTPAQIELAKLTKGKIRQKVLSPEQALAADPMLARSMKNFQIGYKIALDLLPKMPALTREYMAKIGLRDPDGRIYSLWETLFPGEVLSLTLSHGGQFIVTKPMWSMFNELRNVEAGGTPSPTSLFSEVNVPIESLRESWASVPKIEGDEAHIYVIHNHPGQYAEPLNDQDLILVQDILNNLEKDYPKFKWRATLVALVQQRSQEFFLLREMIPTPSPKPKTWWQRLVEH